MQRALSGSILFTATLCIALGTFLGCSPEKKYKVLSFFFDGVPMPAGVAGGPAAKLVMHQHRPYADGTCGKCHPNDNVELSVTEASNIAEINASVCLRCHENKQTEYAVMHGPVAVGQCLLCHNPHESPIAGLLRAPAVKLCGQCHTPEMMVAGRAEHKDANADCLSCHVGHGGPKHGLLRAQSAPPQRPGPSTAPTLGDPKATSPDSLAGAGL